MSRCVVERSGSGVIRSCVFSGGGDLPNQDNEKCHAILPRQPHAGSYAVRAQAGKSDQHGSKLKFHGFKERKVHILCYTDTGRSPAGPTKGGGGKAKWFIG